MWQRRLIEDSDPMTDAFGKKQQSCISRMLESDRSKFEECYLSGGQNLYATYPEISYRLL